MRHKRHLTQAPQRAAPPTHLCLLLSEAGQAVSQRLLVGCHLSTQRRHLISHRLKHLQGEARQGVHIQLVTKSKRPRVDVAGSCYQGGGAQSVGAWACGVAAAHLQA